MAFVFAEPTGNCHGKYDWCNFLTKSLLSHIEQTCFLVLVPFAVSISSVGETTKHPQPLCTPSLVAPCDFTAESNRQQLESELVSPKTSKWYIYLCKYNFWFTAYSCTRCYSHVREVEGYGVTIPHVLLSVYCIHSTLLIKKPICNKILHINTLIVHLYEVTVSTTYWTLVQCPVHICLAALFRLGTECPHW